VTALREILPLCDSELSDAYQLLSALDDDPTSISSVDINLSYNEMQTFQAPPNDYLTPDSCAAYWSGIYEWIADQTCTLSYP